MPTSFHTRTKNKRTYWKTQKAFRRTHDQRLPEVALDLAAEKMEILRRGCWKGNVHVYIRTRFSSLEAVIRELCERVSQTTTPASTGLNLQHALQPRR